MKRSDLILAVHDRNARMVNPPDTLVVSMHNKIEEVYKILFVMEDEQHKELHELAQVLRKALES